MKIYIVEGWYEYEGAGTLVVTTSEEKANEVALEASKPWYYDDEDKEDKTERYHYDGIDINIWENEKRISSTNIWRNPIYYRDRE